jgi:hypothetical protein
MTMTELFGEPISVYTRAQALEDGVLVDVSVMGREAGFKYPVAVTQAVWANIVVPDPRARQWGQDENGRLWDILWMLSRAAGGGSEILFRLSVIMKERQRRNITLKAHCGPGDTAAPVITILMADED